MHVIALNCFTKKAISPLTINTKMPQLEESVCWTDSSVLKVHVAPCNSCTCLDLALMYVLERIPKFGI